MDELPVAHASCAPGRITAMDAMEELLEYAGGGRVGLQSSIGACADFHGVALQTASYGNSIEYDYQVCGGSE